MRTCEGNRVWAVVGGGKVFRVTFSRSLAELIARNTGREVKRYEARVVANSSAYGIFSQKGKLLRVTLFEQQREALRKNPSLTIWPVKLYGFS